MARDSGRSGVRRHPGPQATPNFEALIFVGCLVGMLAGIVVAGLEGGLAVDRPGRPTNPIILDRAALGLGLGGFAGFFIGLARRGTARGRRPAPAPSTAWDLWDPWLDNGRIPGPYDQRPEILFLEPEPQPARQPSPQPIIERAPEPLIPGRAAVRPRVVSPRTGASIPLEDEIGPMLEQGRGGLVAIEGGPGSGKTAALRHLAAVVPPEARDRLRLSEGLDLAAIADAGPDRLDVVALDPATLQVLAARAPLTAYRLAPWTEDEAIEYLLATDRDACAWVIARLRAAGDFAYLEGIPELCAVALDRMARDAPDASARTALRQALADRAAGLVRFQGIQDLCLEGFAVDARAEASGAAGELMTVGAAAEPMARLIRHRPAAMMLAADRLADLIRRGELNAALGRQYARDLVQEVARRIGGEPDARARLEARMRGKSWTFHPLAASLLHATTPDWRPAEWQRPCLQGAYLDGVSWVGQDLSGVDLRRADLAGALLDGANLERALARRARLRGARLVGAVLDHCGAAEADLSGADLTRASARQAQFHGADLTDAHLIEADLSGADLTGARIDGADFSGANLEGARLGGLPLRRARIDGAHLAAADLHDCGLEGLDLPAADFHLADLSGARLTGSRLPGANLLCADLRNARLGEVDWPGACLRGTSLGGADFHLISRRLDPPGWRTDPDAETARPIEEIRTANLRGADLRGADLGDVDFYRVDLRGALYDADQVEHLRRCGAFLDDRPA